eukprot:5768817-Karenia_brevis.AAC.1
MQLGHHTSCIISLCLWANHKRVPGPIALMPMLYRIWTKVMKPYIQMWERANAGPWGAAVEGSSALRAALTS